MAERTFSVGGAFQRVAGSDDLVVDMAFASAEPYERWFGIEVLRVTEQSVRLARLQDGAPLLFNHNWDDLRGVHVPGSVRADADEVLRGQVRITSATQIGRDTIGLVESGVLTKASTGYQIHKVIEQTTSKSGERISRELDGSAFERVVERCQVRDGRRVRGDLAEFRRALDEVAGPFDRAEGEPATYIVIDWEPLENSLVTVPADPTVGVGRGAEVRNLILISQPAAQTANQGANMADTKNVATGASADGSQGEQATRQSPVEIERERRQAIQNLCKANKIDARTEERWIVDGASLSDVANQLLDVLEERGKTKPSTASALGLSNSEAQRYSMFRAIRALHYGGKNPQLIRDAAFEIECSNAVAKRLGRETTSILVPSEVLSRPLERAALDRAMSTTPGSKGGYMVDTTNMGFVDVLRNRSVAMSMGARVISGLEGNVSFTRQTGKGTVSWQAGEGSSITAADQALGQLSMTPRTAIAITDVSEQLLRQSSPSAEAFVMADLARDIAIDGVDAAVINGTGGAQPLGIKNTTGVTTGQDAGTVTYAKVLAFVSTAAAANAILSNPGFVTNAAGAAILMQKSRFANTDTPLWDGNILDGICVGFRAMASEQLASANLIFGSWGEVIIGEWGVLELATDTGGTRFNQAQVGIRAMWMVDVLVRYPQAFVVSTSLSA